MRRQRRAGAAAAVALAAALGCAGQIPPPTTADAVRASAQWPGTTVDALAAGRSLYIEHCSGCHPLHRPDSQPPAAWSKIVREMATRAQLDAPKATAVIRYLTIAADALPTHSASAR